MRGVYVPVRETQQQLVWNVFVGNFNLRRIEVYNIFDHSSFRKDCAKNAKKFKNDKASFAEGVRGDLMYYFWSKCEWEIILSRWPSHDDDREEKVDVYTQVAINWDQFIDYLWENRGKLKNEA